MNYYNEFDPNAAAWLRGLIKAGLIPPGEVDERSIKDVLPNDLRGFAQCHFFAGIGGWSLALQLAGWPEDRPAWTGSCPCQPFSDAGEGLGEKDERHLWPELLRLIRERRPSVVFGEQVASKAGREWLSGVRIDVEAVDYALGAADLCAAGVGAPHIRQRLYWGAYSKSIYGKAHGRLDASGIRRSSIPDGRFPRIFNDGTWIIDPDEGGERMPSIVRSFNGLSSILAGYGNAIVPQVAAEFIIAAAEAIN